MNKRSNLQFQYIRFTLIALALVLHACTSGGGDSSSQSTNTTAEAQTGERLSGMVAASPNDASAVGQNAGATVYIVGQQEQATTTDANGNFELSVNTQLSGTVAAAPGKRGVARTSAQMYGLVVLSKAKTHGRKVDVQVAAGEPVSVEQILIDTVGSISGYVFLEGATDHSGIKVYIPGTDFFTYTSADGSYTITGVPSGTYNILRAEKTGVTEYALVSQVTVNTDAETAPPDMHMDSVPLLHTVAAIASPTQGGSVTGGGTYVEGATVTVTVSANSGYVFTGWTEGASQVATSASYSFTATADRSLTANFAAATDTTPPAITMTSPAGGATGVPVNTVVSATFSESMDAATLTGGTFTLSDGTTSVVGMVAYAGGTATFTPSSSLAYATTYTATITTGAKDSAGNAMGANYVWTFTTEAAPDTAAPTVASTSPASAATSVAVTAVISATFSEAMDSATINAGTFTLSDGTTSVTGSVTYAGGTATFTPSSSLAYTTTYTATITTGAKDIAGNALSANYVWTFTTGADTTPPVVASVSPPNGSIGVPSVGPPIRAVFSEAMDVATLNSMTFTVSPALMGSVTADAVSVTFTPMQPLAFSTTYTVTVTTGAKDVAGNALSANYVWTFTTEADPSADTTPPTVDFTSPPGGATNVSASVVDVTFSEVFLYSTLIESSFLVSDGVTPVTGTILYDYATKGRFVPTGGLAKNTTYTATITTAVTDQADNPLAADYVWSFTTGDRLWGAATVNISGNPAGTTGEYPQVAVDSTGNAIAVWERFDGTRRSIWSNRYVVGTGWGTAGAIETDETGDASRPQVAVDLNGNAIAVWHQSDGTRTNIWANSYTVASGWGTASLIESDDTGHAAYPHIAMNANGDAIAVWLQSNGTRDSVWARPYTSGAGWGTAGLIEFDDAGDATFPQIAIDPNGNGVAVWIQFDGTRSNVWSTRYTPGSGWAPPAVIENDSTGSAMYSPRVAIDPNGNAIAVWQYYVDASGTFDVWTNRYTAASSTWGTAARLESNSTIDGQEPQVAMDPNGNAIAVWYEFDGTYYRIWANRFSAGWGTAVRIDNDVTGSTTLPHVAIDPSGNAVAVWRQGIEIWGNRYLAASGWTIPGAIGEGTVFGSGTAWLPRVGMDANGNAIAVWYGGTTYYDIRANRLQ